MRSKSSFQFRFRPWLALWLCLVAGPVIAADSYLAGSHLDPLALLAPPPEAASAEQKADLATVAAAFHGRTPEEEVAALGQQKINVFAFGPSIGPIFQPGRLPKTQALLAKVVKDASRMIGVGKDYWKRPRPYTLDTNLFIGNIEPSFSYPSGHSTISTINALLLAELFPAKRDAILEFGRNVGWHRVVIAKHFPTDVYAGRVLGQAIVRELKANADFQHDFAEAQAEIANANRSNGATE